MFFRLIYILFLSFIMLAPIAPIMAQQSLENPTLQQVRVDQHHDQNQIIYLQQNQELVVTLESNPATGYSWDLEEKNLASLPLQVVGKEFQPESNLLGTPGILKLRIVGKQAGSAELKFVYRRPWLKYELPAKQFRVNVQTLGSFPNRVPDANNSVPANSLNSFDTIKEIVVQEPAVDKRPHIARAENSPTSSTEQPNLEGNLSSPPATFNWCDNGGCTPVKDQGYCGSCWAFGTVGPLESNILMKTSQTKDLAEQYLVSCNSDGWGCNGGWFAHDYHWNKKISGEPDAGAVYESDFPYRAIDVACNPPHTHQEKLTNWNYVNPSNQDSVASVDAIKQAIYTYGPVSAAVCVGWQFQMYTSGVFSSNDYCGGGEVNHAIVLVGWDDSQGVWYLRNSWGPSWGESGYMRIKYNTSNVGYAASYVSFSSLPTLTVGKAGNGSGTVTSSPSGIDCGTDCSETYASGTTVTLTASPATDSTFTGWSGACSGAGSCQVTMSQARTVTATFKTDKQYTLTVSKTGTGSGAVISSPAGISCGVDCSETYTSGTVVKLTAMTGVGSQFAGWGGACSGTGSCQVTMSQAQTVTATFNIIPTYTLTVSKTGTGRGAVISSPMGISCGADCRETYTSGTLVKLTAMTGVGSQFAGWGGACSGTSPYCWVVLFQAQTVTATFSIIPTYTLTVSKKGTGSGAVISSPMGINCGADCRETYTSGTLVKLTAMTGVGSQFAGWGGACSGTSPYCWVTLSQAQTVIATFKKP